MTNARRYSHAATFVPPDEQLKSLRQMLLASERKLAEVERQRDALVEALKPFARFADAFEAAPIRGLDPIEIYSIHGGDCCEPFGCTLKWEHVVDARHAIAVAGGK